MMVIDASAWVSRLVPQDEHHQVTRQWLETYLTAYGRLAVPIVLLAEVAGAVSRRTRRANLVRQAVEGLLRLRGVRVVAVDRRLGQASAQLAAALHLRGADAISVALAQQLNLPLVTWNQEQQARARQVITVYTPATAP